VRRKGTTLVELLVVITIILLLASFAIPSFARYLAHARLQLAGTTLVQDLQTIQTCAIGDDDYYTIVFITNQNRYYFRPGTTSYAPAGAVSTERQLSTLAGFPLVTLNKVSPVSAVFGPESSSRAYPIVTMSFNGAGRPSQTGGGHVTLVNRYYERIDVVITPVDGHITMRWVTPWNR